MAIPPPPPRDASEGNGPERRPQRRLGRRLEEVAEAVGGGYCRLRRPSKPALMTATRPLRNTRGGSRVRTAFLRFSRRSSGCREGAPGARPRPSSRMTAGRPPGRGPGRPAPATVLWPERRAVMNAGGDPRPPAAAGASPGPAGVTAVHPPAPQHKPVQRTTWSPSVMQRHCGGRSPQDLGYNRPPPPPTHTH